MAYTIISQNNNTTTLTDGVNTITVPSRVNLTSGNFTIVEVNNNMATLEDGDGNVYRDIPCVATLVDAGGGGGSSLPDQTGHSGEFLTTDGTDASWSDKPLVNTATGTDSLSVGKATTANNVVTVVNSDAASVTTAQGSAVVGSGAVSQARDGVAFGRLASVYSTNGEYGIAIGGNSSTRGRSGINIGYGAGSNGGNGDYGIAIGREAQAKQNYSIQLGNGSNNEAGTFYVASYYNSANVNYKLMDADGTIPTARFTTDPVSDGTYYPTLTISSGTPTRSWSTINALQNTATGFRSIGVGTSSTVTYTNCTIIGYGATTTGNYGTAFGDASKAANCGVSLGSTAISSGQFSTAVGYTAKATKEYSVSFGCGAETTAVGAIQVGYGTNNEVGTLCIGLVKSASPWDQTNYKLLDSDGTIPAARHAALPAADGTYTLQLVITDGVPTLSWVAA